MWLTFAIRPLTVDEIRESLAFDVGDKTISKDRVLEPHLIPRMCLGLVSIDEETSQLHFIHFSLKEYLKSTLSKYQEQHHKTEVHPKYQDSHTLMARKCLTYLCFDDFSSTIPWKESDFEDRLAQNTFLGYAAGYWGHHARQGSFEDIRDLVLALFSSTTRTMAAGLVMATADEQRRHYKGAYEAMTKLHVAASFKLGRITELLLEASQTDLNTTTLGGWTPLHWAARSGCDISVSALLSLKALVRSTTSLDQWNGIHIAAKEGHEVTLSKLLDALEASNLIPEVINAKDTQGRTALYLASWAGHERVVQSLLEHGADPNVRTEHETTALHCAAKSGHLTIVKGLLDHGSDPTASDILGQTPLDEAHRRMQQDVARLLEQVLVVRESADSNSNSKLVQDLSSPSLDQQDLMALDVDLDWSSYEIDTPRSASLKQGGQAQCHILTKRTILGQPQMVRALHIIFDIRAFPWCDSYQLPLHNCQPTNGDLGIEIL